ncbi:hypothetical protein [Fictibacillus terranigra]|uniref:Uncharacterized protein n=1 Tax=Fictibacillus terranigra TaxID=3058424 RepID=A0ABT8EBN4_9BACL|nr:hypothetical protein [Fictibacillus sp. CENA-BCM004]MDN4075338.1 hypothetical protein [Fictibacillus sp. CENA-BCM004]
MKMVRDEMQKRILRWLEERDNQKKQFVFQVNGSSVDRKGKKTKIVYETVELLSEGQFIETIMYEGCTGKRKAHFRLNYQNVCRILNSYLDQWDKSIAAYTVLEF